MAGSVNKVILIGNLGKDPEVRYLDSGRGFAKFPIATSEVFKDRSTGERREQTEWHNITIWRQGLVDVAEKYLKKGNKVYIEGKLRTRSWEDEDKNTRYITEVIVDNMTLLGGPASPDDGGSTQQPASQQAGNKSSQKAQSSPQQGDQMPEPDDDLPF